MTISKLSQSMVGPNEGFIVVAALWMLAALAALVTVFSIYVANSAMSLRIIDEKAQSESVVAAALELTLLQRLTDPARPTRGSLNFRIAGSEVAVNFVTEAARIDLNYAPKALLAGLFKTLGASPENASQYADRIVGWRTPPVSASGDTEASLYREAHLSYVPRGGPFAHINELWLVHGLPAAVVEQSLPYVTVFSGRPDVNVFDAPLQVIASLPGISAARLSAFLNLRSAAQPDWQSALEALGAGQTSVTTAGSEAIRVSVRISFDNGGQSQSEVIILPAKGDVSFRILSWRDDVDTESIRDRTRTATR